MITKLTKNSLVNPLETAKLVHYKNVNLQFMYIKTNNIVLLMHLIHTVAKSIAPVQDMLGNPDAYVTAGAAAAATDVKSMLGCSGKMMPNMGMLPNVKYGYARHVSI